jgi:transcriptional regulator with XRE-family HTH domain
MNLLAQIGKRIQLIREKRGMTQEQLEEKTGINAKYISAVECGQRNVTIKTLEKIAKGLDAELFELFLFSESFGSDKSVKKALDSLMKDADTKTLNLCLEFLKKAAG